MASMADKLTGSVVEYLDQGKVRPGVAMREQGERVTLLRGDGREQIIDRDLVLLRHPGHHANRENAKAQLAALEEERDRLKSELDLNLLWEVVREQGRSFSAADLAELFFGRRSTVGTAVLFEALLGDRLYFVRRHMEFIPQSPEQVERLRLLQEKTRLKTAAYRKTQSQLRELLASRTPGGAPDDALAAELRRYLDNPFSRSTDLTTMLSQAAPELLPAEAAYEILSRSGQAPEGSRFAVIASLRRGFSADALDEARNVAVSPRAIIGGGGPPFTIDDEETREIDDALSCEPTPSGGLRVWIYITLAADFVTRDTALDREAAARAVSIYLPEATIRMLPEEISCERASLVAGAERPVLATEVTLEPDGELTGWSIRPGRAKIAARLDYDQANRILAGAGGDFGAEVDAEVRQLYEMAMKLRERRRRAGAVLFQRREVKIHVRDNTVEVQAIEAQSPSRLLVAEFMVLSNFVAARYASRNNLPIIYRVQPDSTGSVVSQRPRLSLFPDFHAGIGLDCYAQISSPIRRYADLALQRQLVAGPAAPAYRTDDLMAILANAENAEQEAKELERRAKRYWLLRYLQQTAMERPLEAIALREGATAELVGCTARGTLRAAPAMPHEAPIYVQIAKIDPLRGWLILEYLGQRTASTASADAPVQSQ